MFTWLLLRKANFKRIEKILVKENLIFTDEDINNLLKGNQKGTRYGNAVFLTNDGAGQQKRFIKIMLDGTWRTYKLFERQVEVTKALSEDKQYNFHKLAVLSHSLKPPVPYAVFETREEGEGFGFMHDSPQYYESFSELDVSNLAKLLYGFHHSAATADKKLFKHTQKVSLDLRGLMNDAHKHLDTVITHKSVDGLSKEDKVENLLISYLQMSDAREAIDKLLEDHWKIIANAGKRGEAYLVHADVALDNIYRHRDGNLELLDFEWVGTTNNPALSIIYDYGNLRARAWSSPNFQAALDKAMLEEGIKHYGNEGMVKSALTLAIIRFGVMMSRYHLDFKNTVKKDRRTEEDYFSMFPKTLASLEKVLKS